MRGETESYLRLHNFYHAFMQYCFCMSGLKSEAVGHVNPTDVEIVVLYFKIFQWGILLWLIIANLTNINLSYIRSS